MTMGNKVRTSGRDRCWCGCKYWENDRCIDCGGREPMRAIAEGRDESEPCEAGTPGCSIDHSRDDGGCAPW